jgi:hypothetical protein
VLKNIEESRSGSGWRPPETRVLFRRTSTTALYSPFVFSFQGSEITNKVTQELWSLCIFTHYIFLLALQTIVGLYFAAL